MTQDDERYIGFLISDTARLLRTVFDRRVRKLGITRSQWLVLVRLHRRPGASQSELAEMLEIERPSAGRLIDRLEANGWVERRTDPGDRRVNRLYLTPRAEQVHMDIWPVAQSTVEDALAGLSGAERQQLADLVRRVKAELQLQLGGDAGTDATSASDSDSFAEELS